jgi:glyoxylase-like metal-dependent hydrolase (beta-lactamase superfamily II)
MQELLVQDAHNEAREGVLAGHPVELAGAAGRAVAEGVWYLRTAIVNLFFVQGEGTGWVLVDAGIPGFGPQVESEVERHFGAGARPEAIVLTHGHFDHVGMLRTFADRWDVPIYAHRLEMPYLTGRAKYPPPDPSVGGGFMAVSSPLYPSGPIDVSDRVRRLPEDGTVPGLEGWRWIHTPGHTPGHVSLFREADRTLIAGDAVITTKQESAMAVMDQRPELHGPPMYFTPDWVSAARSARALAALEPETLATGHGRPLRGAMMRAALHELARDFEHRAVPRVGRYVNKPALADENGVTFLPPPVDKPLLTLAAAVAAGVLLGAVLGRRDE